MHSKTVAHTIAYGSSEEIDYSVPDINSGFK